MRWIIFFCSTLCLMLPRNSNSQTISQLIYALKQKYLAMESVSARLSVVEVRADAISQYTQNVFADNRNGQIRILTEPLFGRIVYFKDNEVTVLSDKEGIYYIEQDTIALLRVKSYLDNISSVFLARELGSDGSGSTTGLPERIITNDQGITECSVLIPDNPDLGIRDYAFVLEFDMTNVQPVRERMSYQFLGDIISKEITVDTVYSNVKELDSMLIDIKQKVNKYQLLEAEPEEEDPQIAINFPEFLDTLTYINHPLGKSKFYLLDFYFVQCAPCLKAIPFLKEIEKNYSPDLISILAVNDVDKREKIDKYVSNYNISYSLAMIDKAYLNNHVGIVAHPSFLLISEDGTILLQQVGFDPAFFDKVVQVLNDY